MVDLESEEGDGNMDMGVEDIIIEGVDLSQSYLSTSVHARVR